MTTSLPDVSRWLIYYPDRLDTSRSLWFVRDILDVDAIGGNAVALASGADFDDFASCAHFLSAFPSIFVALSDRETAEIVVSALRDAAVMTPLLLPRDRAFGRWSSVVEVLHAGGEKAVSHLMMGAREEAPGGMLDMAEIVPVDLTRQPAVLSGIRLLDKSIGGFFPGELSVWTGKRGSGKSTLLGQTLLDAIDQGHCVCAYSGELAAWRFKEWAALQAAGPFHVEERVAKISGKTVFAVPTAATKLIDEWWGKRFFLYDNRVSAASDENSILSVFEYAVRRYGCAVFLVDNLMTARFSTSADRDFYRAQSNFAGRLVEFAKKYEVHVHLVAHPRKTEKIADADEVGGSGDITNRADNVFSLERLDEKKAEERGYNAVLTILKNRSFGDSAQIGLTFDPRCRRFDRPGDNPKHYGWEIMRQTKLTEVQEDGTEPF